MADSTATRRPQEPSQEARRAFQQLRAHVLRQEKRIESRAVANFRVQMGIGSILTGVLARQRLKSKNPKKWDVIAASLATVGMGFAWWRILFGPTIED